MPPNVSPAETLIGLFAEPDFLGGYPPQYLQVLIAYLKLLFHSSMTTDPFLVY